MNLVINIPIPSPSLPASSLFSCFFFVPPLPPSLFFCFFFLPFLPFFLSSLFCCYRQACNTDGGWNRGVRLLYIVSGRFWLRPRWSTVQSSRGRYVTLLYNILPLQFIFKFQFVRLGILFILFIFNEMFLFLSFCLYIFIFIFILIFLWSRTVCVRIVFHLFYFIFSSLFIILK